MYTIFILKDPVISVQYLNKEYDSDVPLVLMNSFNTHEDTEKIKHRYEHRVSLHLFEQSKFPRISKESLCPIATSINSSHSW